MSGRVFIAGRIHALQGDFSGNALVVEQGRIVAHTSAQSARERFPKFEVVDLGDATITPGLTDSHIHLTEWAVARAQVDLAPARTIEQAAALAAAGRAHDGWILGRGWNPHHWGGAYPDRHALDAVRPDLPVVLQSHDMHALWLNSRALERVGLVAPVGDPDGGRILREAEGVAAGVLLENAAQLVVPHLPRYSVDSILPLVIDAQRELHGYGITGVHSFPGVHLKNPDPVEVVQAMRARGDLALRVLQHVSLENLDIAIRRGMRSGLGDDWFRFGGVKMFPDGALGSRTAWMQQPYENSADCGVQVMSENDFRDAVERASRKRIATVVHAIGDAAVALAFDVLSDRKYRVAAMPHRVEHVQCMPPSLAQFDDRIVCSVQPSHLMTDWRAADTHWGARAARTYAFAFMRTHGAVLAFGSDAPVEPADPRHGLYAAVTRTDLAGEPAGGWQPQERIDVRAALAAYSLGPAHVAGIAPQQAGLNVGALADFVAWKQDPMTIEPGQLLRLEPAATVVGGDIVFET